MRSIKKSGITALTAAIALGIGAVPIGVASGFVPGVDTDTTIVPTTDYFDGGKLTLSTDTLSTGGSSGSVTWDGDAGLVQTISEGSGCRLVEQDDNLLSIEGYVGGKLATAPFTNVDTSLLTDLASFRGGAIGVVEDANSAICNRVDPNSFGSEEWLRLSIGGDLPGVVAKSAKLDIEARSKDVFIRATMYKAGGFVGYAWLWTGRGTKTDTAITGAPATPSTPVSQNANTSWTVDPGADKYFDTVTLEVVQGLFSLEGGDDSNTTPTEFAVATEPDETLCAPGVPNSVSFIAEDNAKVQYLGTASGTVGDCFGVVLTASDREVRFLKPPTISADAQFVFDIVWTVPPGETSSLPATKVDFETPAEGTEVPLGWCPDPVFQGTVTIDDVTVPKLVGIANPLGSTIPDLDPIPADNGYQAACVGSQSARAVDGSPDVVKVIEQIYVLGDIKLLR